MDLIRALRALLDPLVEQTPFILTEFRPLEAEAKIRYGALEYHGTLNEGWMSVLLGIYQLSARRTITAEMWVPENALRQPPGASIDSAALHRQVWVYGPQSDGDALVRSIVAEVRNWLEPFGAPIEPDSESPSPGS